MLKAPLEVPCACAAETPSAFDPINITTAMAAEIRDMGNPFHQNNDESLSVRLAKSKRIRPRLAFLRPRLICPSCYCVAVVVVDLTPQITAESRHPVPQGGRWPSSRTLGRDAVDAAVPARKV